MNDPNRVTKWLLLIGLVVVSLLLLYPPDEKLKGGIDLVGGTSLLFEIDTSDLDANEQSELSARVMRILKDRVDPQGQMNLEWRPVGNTRLEIRMPLPPKKARDRRDAYDAALEQLAEMNTKRRQIEEALGAPPDQRDAQLAGLKRGVEARAPLIEQVKTTYDKYTQAKLSSDEAAVAAAAEEYERALSALLAANFPINRFTDVLSLKPPKRDAELDKLRAEFVAFDAGNESETKGKLLSKAVKAHDAWARYKADLEDSSDLKRRIRGAGVLEFRILAERDASSPDSTSHSNPQLRQPISKYTEQLARFGPRARAGDVYQWFPIEDLTRFMHIKDVEEFRANKDAPGRPIVEEYAGRWYVLAHNTPENYMLHGATTGRKWKLMRAIAVRDPLTGRNVVSFTLDPRGGAFFGELTGANVERPLCIVLDNQAMSFATINERITEHCQISGSFTPEQAQNLVLTLEAGSLPARLKEPPLSEVTIGPSLGQTNRERGMQAAMWGGVATLIIVFILYGFVGGGVVNFALVLNMLLVLAIMSLMQATFTLPGIAGLILSVAMGVDANVLIFERYREERARGVPFKKAVLAGYDKAFSTILDSNLTTILSAAILVAVGSEEIKGFGIVLGVGIAVSMFTSLTVTRLIYTTLMANDWIKNLRIIPLPKPPAIDWLALRRIFYPASLVATLGGVALFLSLSARDKQTVFDIEFLGGTSVQLDFQPRVSITDEQLEDAITHENLAEGDSAVEWLLHAADALPNAQIGVGAQPGQFTLTLKEFNGAQLASLIAKTMEPRVEKNGVRAEASVVVVESKPGQLSRESLPELLQMAASRTRQSADRLRSARVQHVTLDPKLAEGKQSFEVVTTETNRDVVQTALLAVLGDKLEIQRAIRFDTKKDGDQEFFVVDEEDHYLTDVIGEEARFDVRAFRGGVAVVVELTPDAQPITEQEIQQRLLQVGLLPEFEHLRTRESMVQPLGQTTSTASGKAGFKRFAIVAVDESMFYSEENRAQWAEQVAASQVALIRAALENERSLSKVVQFAPQIAGQARSRALFALLLSLVGVSAYLWLRFGTIDFGVAAIIALVHDVAFTIGCLAVSHLLWNTFVGRIFLLEGFKMDSSMLAAVLTIVGYSLNDKIVIFDRIRENKGKSSALSANLINSSISQTLSRTLLTAVTTLVVLLVLYAMGGKGVHGFSFALFIGVVIGTYSSFGVAVPLLYQPRLMWSVAAVLTALALIGVVFVNFEDMTARLIVSLLAAGAVGALLYRGLRRGEGRFAMQAA